MKKDIKIKMNLAIIGAKNTGKTSYLYSIHQKGHLATIGDEDSSEYLKNVGKNIDKKGNAEATAGTFQELYFSIDEIESKFKQISFYIADYDGHFTENFHNKEEDAKTQMEKLRDSISNAEGCLFFIPYDTDDIDKKGFENFAKDIDEFINLTQFSDENKSDIPASIIITKWDKSNYFKAENELEEVEKYLQENPSFARVVKRIRESFMKTTVIPISSFKNYNLLEPIIFSFEESFNLWYKEALEYKKEKNYKKLVEFLSKKYFSIKNSIVPDFLPLYKEAQEEYFKEVEKEFEELGDYKKKKAFLEEVKPLFQTEDKILKHLEDEEKKVEDEKKKAFRKKVIIRLIIGVIFIVVAILFYLYIEKKEIDNNYNTIISEQRKNVNYSITIKKTKYFLDKYKIGNPIYIFSNLDKKRKDIKNIHIELQKKEREALIELEVKSSNSLDDIIKIGKEIFVAKYIVALQLKKIYSSFFTTQKDKELLNKIRESNTQKEFNNILKKEIAPYILYKVEYEKSKNKIINKIKATKDIDNLIEIGQDSFIAKDSFLLQLRKLYGKFLETKEGEEIILKLNNQLKKEDFFITLKNELTPFIHHNIKIEKLRLQIVNSSSINQIIAIKNNFMFKDEVILQIKKLYKFFLNSTKGQELLIKLNEQKNKNDFSNFLKKDILQFVTIEELKKETLIKLKATKNINDIVKIGKKLFLIKESLISKLKLLYPEYLTYKKGNNILETLLAEQDIKSFSNTLQKDLMNYILIKEEEKKTLNSLQNIYYINELFALGEKIFLVKDAVTLKLKSLYNEYFASENGIKILEGLEDTETKEEFFTYLKEDIVRFIEIEEYYEKIKKSINYIKRPSDFSTLILNKEKYRQFDASKKGALKTIIDNKINKAFYKFRKQKPIGIEDSFETGKAKSWIKIANEKYINFYINSLEYKFNLKDEYINEINKYIEMVQRIEKIKNDGVSGVRLRLKSINPNNTLSFEECGNDDEITLSGSLGQMKYPHTCNGKTLVFNHKVTIKANKNYSIKLTEYNSFVDDTVVFKTINIKYDELYDLAYSSKIIQFQFDNNRLQFELLLEE